MTEQEIKDVLQTAISSTVQWRKVYSSFFGIEVTASSLDVKYMRSLTNHAGPIKEGSKRYNDVKDNTEEQEEVVTRF